MYTENHIFFIESCFSNLTVEWGKIYAAQF